MRLLCTSAIASSHIKCQFLAPCYVFKLYFVLALTLRPVMQNDCILQSDPLEASPNSKNLGAVCHIMPQQAALQWRLHVILCRLNSW